MKFSELWLRSYVNPPLDSAALSHLLTMAGLEVEAMEPASDDRDNIFTLKLTPNRSDCLSLTGLAREVSTLTSSKLRLPIATPMTATDPLPPPSIIVMADEACPLYCGQTIRGIGQSAKTPEWMVERLTRSGIRSLGTVVDITNYVMLETGQPLHAFDLAKLSGAIEVRMANAGESLILLNEQSVKLDSDMLVIADQAGVQALAGIMGGAASAVTSDTADIFIESAFFHPDYIAGRARRLGLSTDASHRFERGVDFAATKAALMRVAQLIVEICGGDASVMTEVVHALPKRLPIHLRPARASKILGIKLGHADVAKLLRRLKFEFVKSKNGFDVTPPSYRFDLAIESDLIEELARLYGYDNIPAIVPIGALSMLPSTELSRSVNDLRNGLVAHDYQEVITYGFVDAELEADLSPNLIPVALKNPIASHMSVMRSTLIGGLLNTLQTNLNRGQSRVRITEAGHCYLATNEGKYAQPLHIAGLAYGSALPEQWGAASRNVDFYDVKADIVATCAPQILRFEAQTHPALHPGQSASVWLGEERLGWIGSLHPALMQKFNLSSAPVIFELAVAPLLKASVPKYNAVSKLPFVCRDLAVVVSQAIPAQDLIDAMWSANIPGIINISIFDVYRGPIIGLKNKSLAFRVSMQDDHKTFTDSEVDATMAHLTELLRLKFNAQLRS